MRKSKFAAVAVAALAGVSLTGASAMADRDDVRVHGDRGERHLDAGDRHMDRGDRHFDRDRGDRHFDRGAHVEIRDRDWRRPEYRERIIRGHRYDWGPGVGFYFSDGYYYGECGWLRRRAEVTGDPLWWHRFRLCRDFG